MSTRSFSRFDVVLVRYPFTDLSGSKIRPAVIVSPPFPSADLMLTSLTSQTTRLLPGEFVLKEWRGSGLHVPTAAKRGIFTLDESLPLKTLGRLGASDRAALESALRLWLGL
jgi:mRNA interferase MazF